MVVDTDHFDFLSDNSRVRRNVQFLKAYAANHKPPSPPSPSWIILTCSLAPSEIYDNIGPKPIRDFSDALHHILLVGIHHISRSESLCVTQLFLHHIHGDDVASLDDSR